MKLSQKQLEHFFCRVFDGFEKRESEYKIQSIIAILPNGIIQIMTRGECTLYFDRYYKKYVQASARHDNGWTEYLLNIEITNEKQDKLIQPCKYELIKLET
jgi:hypothetical protein